MNGDLDVGLDRITYRDGQLLTARDLADDQRGEERRRRLHVQHLHDTWGIALGLTVHAAQSGNAVVLRQGYAVDEAGRDLVLSDSLHLPVPETTAAARFVLTLRYRDDEAFQQTPSLAAVCPGRSGGRRERPMVAWRSPDEVRFGPEVPLVQVTATGGAIQGALDLRVRRHTRPLVRPHLRGGVTDHGRTGWRVWQTGDGKVLGLETEVDTADAGFLRTPHYFAALTGDLGPATDGTALTTPGAWPADTNVAFGPAGPGFLSKAEPARFIFRVATAGALPFVTAVTPVDAESRGWAVAWIGAEPAAGCEPGLDLAKIFSLGGFLRPVILALLPGG